MKKLARHFGAELIAAGLNDGVAWTEDGTILDFASFPASKRNALQALIDAHNPDVPPAPNYRRLYKATLWRRATDEEFDKMEKALAAGPAKKRKIFEAAQYIDHDDPDFPTLRQGIIAAVGSAARADELLAPEF
jgi:hypothetical protein